MITSQPPTANSATTTTTTPPATTAKEEGNNVSPAPADSESPSQHGSEEEEDAVVSDAAGARAHSPLAASSVDAVPETDAEGDTNGPADPASSRPAHKKRLFDMSQRIEMVGNPSEQEVRLLVGKINTYGKKADLYKDMGFHDKSIRMCKMLVSIKAEAFGPDSIMCLQEQAMLAAQYELHGYVKRAESTLKNLRAKLESIEWEHPPLTQHIEYLEKKIADGRRENNQPSPSQHDEQQQQNTWSSKMAWSPSEATDFLDKLLTEEQPKDDGGVNHVTVDMSGVELPERPPIAPGDISTLGIRLSFVNRLVVALGGVKALGDMTTTDMCMEFVKPMTEAKRASLCDVILEKGYDKVVRPARFFISHAWMYRFADVVEALDVFFDREGESNPEQIYIWFDLFTNSQHDTAAKPFDWWEHRFLDAIRSIQNVVMILTPWSNPIPLTRAWCVYEVFACRRTSSNFHITMPTRELISLNDGLKDDPTKFHDVLKSISCALCQATNPTDKDNIFKAVHRIMGFPELDRLVLQTLENWVVDRLDKCIDIPVDKGHSPGNIRRLLNNSIESEEGEEENPNMVEQLEDMAGYHFALGYWRVQQGRYRHAWDPIRANLNSMNVLEIYYKTKGGQRSFQQQIDRAAVLLGTLYERSGQFEKAREEAVSPILNEVLTNIGEEPTQRRRVVPFLALELGMCISEDRQEDVKQWLSVIQSLVPTLLSADGPKGEEIVMLYRQLCRIKANSADSELDRESLLLTLPKIVAKRFGDESEESKECGRLQEGYFIRFGQYSSAVQLIKEKLAAVTSSKGIDATETQIIVKRLYDLYVTMENFQLAESLVKEHVESLKTVLEADNIQLLWWKGELGKAMLAANKTAEAKEVFFQLMQEMQEKLGGASFLFSKTLDLNKLTKDDAVDRRTMRVLYYAGACAKSLGIIFPISEPQRIFFGDGDFDYLDTKILLAEVARDSGEDFKKIACHNALDAYQRSKYFHGDYNPKTIQYSFRLGKIFDFYEMHDEATEALDRSLKLADANVGPYDPLTLDIADFVCDRRLRLAATAESGLEAARADGLVDRAFLRRVEALGRSHPATLQCELRLARRLLRANAWEEARVHAENVAELAEDAEVRAAAVSLLSREVVADA